MNCLNFHHLTYNSHSIDIEFSHLLCNFSNAMLTYCVVSQCQELVVRLKVNLNCYVSTYTGIWGCLSLIVGMEWHPLGQVTSVPGGLHGLLPVSMLQNAPFFHPLPTPPHPQTQLLPSSCLPLCPSQSVMRGRSTHFFSARFQPIAEASLFQHSLSGKLEQGADLDT